MSKIFFKAILQRWAIALIISLPLGITGLAAEEALSTAQSAPAHRSVNPTQSVQTRPARPQSARRVKFVPPPMKFNRGAPGNRGHNASRDPNCLGLEVDSPGLTALVPTYIHQEQVNPEKTVETEYVASLTSSPQPVLWTYVPVDPTAETASLEWILQDEAGTEIYYANLPVPNQSGLVRIAPESTPEMEAGQSYQWLLIHSVTCAGESEPIVDYDEGTVEYRPVAESTNIESTPPKSTREETGEEERAEVLAIAAESAEAGYWHEALDLVAQIRQQEPQNAEAEAAWQSLLTDIGLANLIDSP